jgi:hypothetical protein
VGRSLPADHRVEAVVYPQYETKGELAQATEAFVEWCVPFLAKKCLSVVEDDDGMLTTSEEQVEAKGLGVSQGTL